MKKPSLHVSFEYEIVMLDSNDSLDMGAQNVLTP